MSFEELKSPSGATIMHWVCDQGCGTSADVASDSFYAAWTALKAQRWTATRDRDGEWLHRCPKCQRTAKQILASAKEILAGT